MKYSPAICQSQNCSELNVFNSCTATELPKDLSQLVITVEYNTIATSVTIPVTTQDDIDGILLTVSTEDFLSFTFSNVDNKSVANITYSITIENNGNSDIFQYANAGGTWDDVLNGLAILINANVSYTAIYDGTQVIVTGTGIYETTSMYSNTSNIEVLGPLNASGDGMPNAIYTITSDLTYTDATTDQMILYAPFTCKLESCIFTEFANLFSLFDCGCNKDCTDAIIEAKAKLDIIHNRTIENQKDIDLVNEIISQLEVFCDNKDCNCNG